MSEFASNRDKGFHMVFANGWTVSVQFGAGNYCANRNASFDAPTPPSPDAEVAAWDAEGNWHDFGDDEVKGWLTTDEVAAFISRIANGGGQPKREGDNDD